jgi:hypothetical protein
MLLIYRGHTFYRSVDRALNYRKSVAYWRYQVPGDRYSTEVFICSVYQTLRAINWRWRVQS